jgi:hypothetical protein
MPPACRGSPVVALAEAVLARTCFLIRRCAWSGRFETENPR